jgi:branched-chain amino acid transport system ATP-binding protein
LTVRFGPVEVCRGIDLDLREGAIGALVGSNGAGKSTILRALAGAIPAQGSIRLFGRELSGLSSRRRVQQGLVLAAGGRGTFPSLTVEESVALGARDPREKGRATAVEEAFSLFPHLGDRRRQRSGTLSAGEQQLVTLARALVASPRVLLVDELALGLASSVAEEVGKVIAARGNAVLVDQSMSRALSLASWAWLVTRGELRFSGPAGELAGRRDLLPA